MPVEEVNEVGHLSPLCMTKYVEMNGLVRVLHNSLHLAEFKKSIINQGILRF